MQFFILTQSQMKKEKITVLENYYQILQTASIKTAQTIDILFYPYLFY